MLDTADNRREKLPEIWKQLLLVHPSSTIVTDLLKAQVSLESFEVDATMACLMVCAIDEIRREVAKVIWRREYEPEYFFTVLGNRGLIPSGIQYEEGKRAALIMREYCPDSKKEWFRKKAVDLFGPSVTEEVGVNHRNRPFIAWKKRSPSGILPVAVVNCVLHRRRYCP